MKSEKDIRYIIKDVEKKTEKEILKIYKISGKALKLSPKSIFASGVKGATIDTLKAIIKDGKPRYSVAELKKIADKFYPNINFEFFEVLEDKERVEAILK